MSNITINTYFIQSPFVTCVIQINGDETLSCQVHRMWVEKGEGKFVVTFQNNLDFRTMVQVDIQNVLRTIMRDIQEIDTFAEICIYDQYKYKEDCGLSIFREGWNICHDALLVNKDIFRLSEFHLQIKIND